MMELRCNEQYDGCACTDRHNVKAHMEPSGDIQKYANLMDKRYIYETDMMHSPCKLREAYKRSVHENGIRKIQTE